MYANKFSENNTATKHHLYRNRQLEEAMWTQSNMATDQRRG